MYCDAVAASDRAVTDPQAARQLAQGSYVVTTIGFAVTVIIVLAVAFTRPT